MVSNTTKSNSQPTVQAIDHIVLTVRDLRMTCEFYRRVLGMGITVFEENHIALTFGRQKINLHLTVQEFEPKALHPRHGTADICFTTSESLDNWKTHLTNYNVAVFLGPIRQVGAVGEMQSIYVRDPDGNLIEIAKYDAQ